MNKIKSEDVQEEMELGTWFGIHTVIRIDPYNGPRKNVLNELIFSNGFKMENLKGHSYKLNSPYINSEEI